MKTIQRWIDTLRILWALPDTLRKHMESEVHQREQLEKRVHNLEKSQYYH